MKIIKYKCPYCGDIRITKKENPKACPKCHYKFAKKIKIISVKEI